MTPLYPPDHKPYRNDALLESQRVQREPSPPPKPRFDLRGRLLDAAVAGALAAIVILVLSWIMRALGGP